jgi:hypothetical protein
MPLAAEAQPTAKVYRIGYLSPGAASQGVSGSFRDALKELGYIEVGTSSSRAGLPTPRWTNSLVWRKTWFAWA